MSSRKVVQGDEYASIAFKGLCEKDFIYPFAIDPTWRPKKLIVDRFKFGQVNSDTYMISLTLKELDSYKKKYEKVEGALSEDFPKDIPDFYESTYTEIEEICQDAKKGAWAKILESAWLHTHKKEIEELKSYVKDNKAFVKLAEILKSIEKE